MHRHRREKVDEDGAGLAGARANTVKAPHFCLNGIGSGLSNGVWNNDGVALAVTVVPRWWQSRWFYLLLSAAVVTTVVLIVRTWSHRRLRQRVARLEREGTVECEHTRIARDIHGDLGANLSRISLLTQSARQGTGRDPAAQLGQIYDTVSEITRSMDEIVWAVNPRRDQVDSLAGYVASYAQALLAAGATGYLLKGTRRDELLAAIDQILHGGSPMSSAIARKVVQSFARPDAAPRTELESLSQREQSVLELLMQGFLYKEISEKLGVSVPTVNTYIRRIYEKLQVRSRSEAIAKYFKQSN